MNSDQTRSRPLRVADHQRCNPDRRLLLSHIDTQALHPHHPAALSQNPHHLRDRRQPDTIQIGQRLMGGHPRPRRILAKLNTFLQVIDDLVSGKGYRQCGLPDSKPPGVNQTSDSSFTTNTALPPLAPLSCLSRLSPRGYSPGGTPSPSTARTHRANHSAPRCSAGIAAIAARISANAKSNCPNTCRIRPRCNPQNPAEYQ